MSYGFCQRMGMTETFEELERKGCREPDFIGEAGKQKAKAMAQKAFDAKQKKFNSRADKTTANYTKPYHAACKLSRQQYRKVQMPEVAYDVDFATMSTKQRSYLKCASKKSTSDYTGRGHSTVRTGNHVICMKVNDTQMRFV